MVFFFVLFFFFKQKTAYEMRIRYLSSDVCSSDLEGDGCTPLGRWPVRGALLRPGRVALNQPLAIPWRWTLTHDGWSDGVQDPAYNRPVRLPSRWSAESLQRDDEAYDIIIVLGHNDDPPVPGAGSAIFFHIWVDGRPTEGCVAIAPKEMRRILPLLLPDTALEISK